MTARITRETIADQAYAALKAQIVAGELAAGQRLLPLALAATLQISPTPVKEALLRLERDGLVETELRRGMVVRRFKPAEINEFYQARTLFETEALRHAFAAGPIPPAVIAAMQIEQDALLASVARRTVTGLNNALRHDRALHAILVTLAGNSLIVAWHNQVMTQTHTVRVYTAASYAPSLLRDEHGAILQALRAGDEAAAMAALRQHLDRSRLDLLTRVAAADAPP